jgi:phospholipid/cholesterol/gamma-HCH transport system substrate-binding protein
MKDQRKTELKVGIAVVVGIILFIWILTWAKSFSLSATDRILKVSFKNVSGLEIGDQVTINGVKKGFVDDLKVQGDDVIVKLSVEKDAPIKEDAVFRIAMLDLMGGKKVEIYPGKAEQLIDYSKVHVGSFTADIATVMSMVGDAQGDITASIKDMKITLTALNNYLTDKQLNQNIKSSVDNLSEAARKLNLMLDENRENLRKLIGNSVELSEEAKNFLTKNKDELGNSLKEFNALLEKTNSLVAKANEFADEIKSKKNNLGKLVYDEDMYSSITQSINKLNELTTLILEQLKGDGFKVDADVDLF